MKLLVLIAGIEDEFAASAAISSLIKFSGLWKALFTGNNYLFMAWKGEAHKDGGLPGFVWKYGDNGISATIEAHPREGFTIYISAKDESVKVEGVVYYDDVQRILKEYKLPMPACFLDVYIPFMMARKQYSKQGNPHIFENIHF